MEENKVLTKLEQIEVIIDELLIIHNIQHNIEEALNIQLEQFDSVTNIAYNVIPAILNIEVDYNRESNWEKLNDLFDNVYFGKINKDEYLKEIQKYL